MSVPHRLPELDELESPDLDAGCRHVGHGCAVAQPLSHEPGALRGTPDERPADLQGDYASGRGDASAAPLLSAACASIAAWSSRDSQRLAWSCAR